MVVPIDQIDADKVELACDDTGCVLIPDYGNSSDELYFNNLIDFNFDDDHIDIHDYDEFFNEHQNRHHIGHHNRHVNDASIAMGPYSGHDHHDTAVKADWVQSRYIAENADHTNRESLRPDSRHDYERQEPTRGLGPGPYSHDHEELEPSCSHDHEGLEPSCGLGPGYHNDQY